MSRVAPVSEDEIERLSNGFGRMGRDVRPSNGFLKISSGTLGKNGWDDLDELGEEEVWGDSEAPNNSHYVTEGFHVFEHSVAEREDSSRSISKSRKSLLTMEMQASNRSDWHHDISENGYGDVTAKEQWISSVNQIKDNGWIDDSFTSKAVPQSAPVSVPIWLKRHGRDNDEDENSKMEGQHCNVSENNDGADEDSIQDEKGSRGRRLPPHEIVAREYARSQTATFSVCEGAGRTLKGMDLRRVRNAVWSRTGFVD